MGARLSLDRRAFAAAAAIAATMLVAGSPALAQQAPADTLELKLAVADPTINPVTDSILRLADSLGYYQKHGVHVTIVQLQGTPQAVAALNAGDVDLADISIDSALRLRGANKLPLRGVVSSTLGPPYLIAAKAGINTAADLVGHSFAIADNGSLDHNLTRAVLGAMGVNPDGPQFVAIGAPSVRVQALAAGKVDATTVSYGSFLPVANTPGISIIVQPDDFFGAAPIQSKFVVALEPTIAAKHDAIQRFVEALVDISRFYDKDAPSWVTDMTKVRDDLSAKQLEATSKFLSGRWCVNGCLNPADVQKTVDFIYKSKDFEDVPPVAAADVIDESFVTSAIKDLGAYQGGGIDAR